MTYQISSTSSETTEAVAAAIGARLRGGEVIVLTSDLGGGKTTFVRGLARGMGSRDHVASPTFTLSRQYKAASADLTLYHFDFYRLPEPGILAAELAEIAGDPKAVVVIEWAGIVEAVLPEIKLIVNIKPTGNAARELDFNYPETLAYLLQEA